mgnify:CR=1 FL=1
MRICSILTSFTYGGAETLVLNLSRQFRASGHDANVVALCDAASVGNSASAQDSIMSRAAADGVPVRSLGIVNRRKPWAGAVSLRREIARLQPDVVHAHTARAIPMLWLAGVRVPVVLTHHNSRFNFPPWLFRLLDRKVDAYVAIGPACAALIRRHARRHVADIINAASEDFRVAAPRRAAAQDFTVLSVGALTAQKDYPTLIRAASILDRAARHRGRRVRVRVAGGGPLMDALRTRIAEEGVDDVVELLGPRSDVSELMSRADVFANSSHYEGLPIAVLEALSSGLPIVATDVPGNGDLIRDGANGLLVPPSDPQALADRLMQVIEDDALYASLSAGAIGAASRFTIGACAEQHLELYAALVEARQRRTGLSVSASSASLRRA